MRHTEDTRGGHRGGASEARAAHVEAALQEGKASPPRESLKIPSLDGLRTVAVLLVFGSHAITRVTIPGRFGVTIFFFLSGYLITTLMRREYDSTNTVSLREFFLRRAFRILPPFFATFVPAVVAMSVGILVGHVDPRAVVAAIFYYANYFMIRFSPEAMPPGTGVLWSLAVEEHFYLVFPGFYLLLRSALPSRRHQALVLLSICGIVLGWRSVLVLHFHPTTIERLRMATDTRIDSILFGCVLAVWGNPVMDKPLPIPDWVWKWVLFPGSLLTILASLAITDDRIRETIRYTIQGIALYPLFIVAIRWPKWGIVRALNWRPVAFLGTLSYSFYLVHDIVLHQIEAHGGGDRARVLLGLPLALALAWLSYLGIEKPSARLRARFAAPTARPRLARLDAAAHAAEDGSTAPRP